MLPGAKRRADPTRCRSAPMTQEKHISRLRAKAILKAVRGHPAPVAVAEIAKPSLDKLCTSTPSAGGTSLEGDGSSTDDTTGFSTMPTQTESISSSSLGDEQEDEEEALPLGGSYERFFLLRARAALLKTQDCGTPRLLGVLRTAAVLEAPLQDAPPQARRRGAAGGGRRKSGGSSAAAATAAATAAAGPNVALEGPSGLAWPAGPMPLQSWHPVFGFPSIPIALPIAPPIAPPIEAAQAAEAAEVASTSRSLRSEAPAFVPTLNAWEMEDLAAACGAPGWEPMLGLDCTPDPEPVLPVFGALRAEALARAQAFAQVQCQSTSKINMKSRPAWAVPEQLQHKAASPGDGARAAQEGPVPQAERSERAAALLEELTMALRPEVPCAPLRCDLMVEPEAAATVKVEAESETEAEAKVITEAEAELKVVMEARVEAEAEVEAVMEAKAEAEVEVFTEAKAEPEVQVADSHHGDSGPDRISCVLALLVLALWAIFGGGSRGQEDTHFVQAGSIAPRT
mmetsp:Transcript_40872/g.87028  ORF Transcript_40872/g.87028 Transcript_40872/m.87028 type:complete len:513 (-) Transcript_40872:184-1722(-)